MIKDMDLDMDMFDFEPETALEAAADLTFSAMRKVAGLIEIRRCKSSKDPNAFFSPPGENWVNFRNMIKGLAQEDCVPVTAEVKNISTEAVDAEPTEQMASEFVPQTDLEHAWLNAMIVLRDVFSLAQLHKKIRKANLANERKLDALKYKEMTNEAEKLALSETKLQNSQKKTPREFHDAVKHSRLTEQELFQAELEAFDRLDDAKTRVDQLLPEAFYEW